MRGSRLGSPRRLSPRWLSGIAALSLLPPVALAVTHASAAGHSGVVGAVPAAFTPRINNGIVYSITQVGDQIVVGGSFTTASPAGGGSTVNQPYVLAFNAASGAISTTFRPNVNGTVNSVERGPKPGEVYIAGAFTAVNGASVQVALLNVDTGQLVNGWHPPAIDNGVDKVLLAHGRLYVAGTFTQVGGKTRRGLASLNSSTGRLTPYLDLPFTGHHNYGTNCQPSSATCAQADPGVLGLAVNPQGSRMVVIGNFTHVGEQPRDQVAMIELNRKRAVLDPHWATLAYTAACDSDAVDSYVRDVAFAPSGRYFVIVARGGLGRNRDHTDSSCDAAARFDMSRDGSNVRPSWVSYTGSDTLNAVGITRSVVYIGGHQRWLNNRYGNDTPGPGAVPRPGLAALNPVSGLPFAWNPGRNPRGKGTFVLLPTSEGLWTGSDTDYIGDHQYLRPKLAFFPRSGGHGLPAGGTPNLPGRIFEVGALGGTPSHQNEIGVREFNGHEVGRREAVSTGAVRWDSVRGAFTVDGKVIYGKTDGNLYARSFDGSTVGAETVLAPYDDPAWANVQTGSGQTYRGTRSSFGNEMPNVTSMFFRHRKLYYTLAGQRELRWRWFEPDSGIVGDVEHRRPSSLNGGNVAGAFVAGHHLYFASHSSGRLMSVKWNKGLPHGKQRVVSRAKGWASRGLFVLSQRTNPTPKPLAKFFTQCNAAGRCHQTATRWNDPAGGVVRYQWNWGDGHYSRATRSIKASHQYRTDGRHTITEIVTTTSGAVAYASYTITVDRPVRKIHFVGATATSGRAASLKLRIPHGVKRGNALLLFDSAASKSVTPHAMHGWALVGRTTHRGLTTSVYRRTARRHDAGATMRVRYPHRVASTAIVAAYRNIASTAIESRASAVAGATKRHRPPAVAPMTRGAWALTFAAQTAKAPTQWLTPHGLRHRRGITTRQGRIVGGVLLDTAGPRRGAFRARAIRSTERSKSAAAWTIALAPAFR